MCCCGKLVFVACCVLFLGVVFVVGRVFWRLLYVVCCLLSGVCVVRCVLCAADVPCSLCVAV